MLGGNRRNTAGDAWPGLMVPRFEPLTSDVYRLFISVRWYVTTMTTVIVVMIIIIMIIVKIITILIIMFSPRDNIVHARILFDWNSDVRIAFVITSTRLQATDDVNDSEQFDLIVNVRYQSRSVVQWTVHAKQQYRYQERMNRVFWTICRHNTVLAW